MSYCINCGQLKIIKTAMYTLSQLIPLEQALCSECILAQTDTQKPVFQMILTDKVVPKSRPRVTKNATFYPARYTTWRSDATLEITQAIKIKLHDESRAVKDLLPFDQDCPIALFVDFYGSLRKNADLDNGIGSILDVLAFESWCLTDDNIDRVPVISAFFHPLPKSTKKNPQRLRTEFKIFHVNP